MSNRSKERYFIRNNRQPEPLESFDSYFMVHFGEIRSPMSLWGACGHCSSLIGFATGHLRYNTWEELRKAEHEGPTEFTLECWERQDEEERYWIASRNLRFEGVKWFRVAHTCDDSLCGGVASLHFEKCTEEKCEALEAKFPSDKYINYFFADLLEKHKKNRLIVERAQPAELALSS